MRVTVEEQLGATADRVWSFVGEFGGVERWHPGQCRCTLSGEGVGGIRTIVRPGSVVSERLDAFDAAARRLSYSIIECDIPAAIGLFVTIELVPVETGTKLIWTAVSPGDSPHGAILGERISQYFRQRCNDLRAVLSAV